MEAISFCFLFAILTGRAILFDFSSSYSITDLKYFGPPGFDWNYHQHYLPVHAQVFERPHVASGALYLAPKE